MTVSAPDWNALLEQAAGYPPLHTRQMSLNLGHTWVRFDPATGRPVEWGEVLEGEDVRDLCIQAGHSPEVADETVRKAAYLAFSGVLPSVTYAPGRDGRFDWVFKAEVWPIPAIPFRNAELVAWNYDALSAESKQIVQDFWTKCRVADHAGAAR